MRIRPCVILPWALSMASARWHAEVPWNLAMVDLQLLLLQLMRMAAASYLPGRLHHPLTDTIDMNAGHQRRERNVRRGTHYHLNTPHTTSTLMPHTCDDMARQPLDTNFELTTLMSFYDSM